MKPRLCKSAYGNIWVLPNDRPRGEMICASGLAPDHAHIEMLCTHLKRGTVAVDAGANFGSFALAFAQAGAIVHAFEPQLEISELLRRSAENTNVLVYPFALGAETGMIAVPKVDYNSTRDFGTVQLGYAGEAVCIITLDQVMLPRLDVLKIDVEGMEPAVLAGAEKTIREFRPLIFAEFSICGKEALLAELHALGYSRFNYFERDLLAYP